MTKAELVARVAELEGEVEGLRLAGKAAAGERLTRVEAAALARQEKAEEERLRWRLLEAVPKKDYVAMSGRQQKVLDQQADRYGLTALRETKIPIPKLLRQFHDFLAKNWARFEKEIEGDAILLGGPEKGSPAAERYRGYKADLAKLELEERQGELLPRGETRRGMLDVAGIIRTAGEQLDREFGPAAREVLDAALDEATAKIAQMFGAE
jgi:hypothetical protein